MFAATVRRLAIPALRATPSFQHGLVLIVGALAATLLGAVAALEFDRLIALGRWLTLPVGQEALVNAMVTAGLTGFLVWVACVLTVRAISAAALRPYHRLADRLERLVDGETDDLADLRGPIVDVRRLARAVFVFQDRLEESRRAHALLQRRYDALYQEQAAERRLLLDLLVGRTAAKATPSPTLDPEPSPDFDLPPPPREPIIVANSTPPGASLHLLGPLHPPPPPMQTTPSVQFRAPDRSRINIAFTSH
ncbi:hypothetical protein [Brevundimonas sp.]|uniref:hypothetical protein n=1 Tax=Brevundimonas sp. TaxID=1871086 RepID=UPI00391A4D1C